MSNQQEISGHLSGFDETSCVCSTYGAHYPYHFFTALIYGHKYFEYFMKNRFTKSTIAHHCAFIIKLKFQQLTTVDSLNFLMNSY